MKKSLRSFLVILIVIACGIGISFAGSYKGDVAFGRFPLFAFCVLMAFAVNWIAFIPAYIFQTEKFFDLTGSLSYIAVILSSFLLASERDFRTSIIITLVVIWAFRLGSFLFKRVLKEGKDGRFDELKVNFLRYLSVWTLQGLWITLTLSAALAAVSSSKKAGLDIFAIIGSLVWIAGFLFEVIADRQKSKWRLQPENKGKFINTGLWSKSRHPNYFGEITLWLGIAIIALPTLQGWQFISLISPVFVTFLLTKVSGVPLLEKRSDEKWGGQEDYEDYKKNTPVLIPRRQVFRD